MRDVMKSIDTIRQEADKRMRAQQSRQSGQQCGPVELKKEVSFKAQAALSTQHQLPNRAANRKAKWRFLPTGVVMLRNALKFLDSIGQKSDKRLRAQQSGEQCGPVGLMKEEDSFKAQDLKGKFILVRYESKPLWDRSSRWWVKKWKQPSPPSISSQTGQQTEKQNGDSSPTGLVMLRNALKFLDSIGQKYDKRLRAQQSGEQCGPVGLMKEEDSFKAQAALSTQHQLPNRAAN
ncbi:hypothetical protein AAFF_G00011630 [Aldrovandia affinis]|uniref:Uncharacterized protein n=1 Tax=Aldrovandia affinis TaxID=143900 RepID=A0AAD7R2X3_9TELE|nr:hypothetical protein AAFF_G00011630 [Aldrovandia affinis]